MNKFSIHELISIGYDYMSELIKQAGDNGEKVNINSMAPFKFKDPKVEYASANDLSKAMYGFMADARNFNDLSEIVEDSEFDEATGVEIYHGFKKPAYAHEFLNDYVYHYGNGLTNDNQYINGFYLTKNKRLATQYTSGIDDDKIKSNVISFKIRDCTSLKMTDLKSIINENGRFLGEELQMRYIELKKELELLKEQTQNSRKYKMFHKSIMSNLSTIAVLLGVDVIIDDEKNYGRDDNEQIIVLNRGKLGAKESDCTRILSAYEK